MTVIRKKNKSLFKKTSFKYNWSFNRLRINNQNVYFVTIESKRRYYSNE